MESKLYLNKAKSRFSEINKIQALFEQLSDLIDSKPLIKQLKGFQEFNDEYRKFEIKQLFFKKKFILEFINGHMKQFFGTFLQTLLHTKQYEAAKFIASEYLADILDLSRCHPESKFNKFFSFGFSNDLDILEKSDKSGSTVERRYPMNLHYRGYCVLINNYLTFGTYKEMQRFRNIFHQLHFEVIMKQNLDFEETIYFLKELSRDPKLKDHSAFVFMILTHGTKEKEFLTFDGKPIKIDYLINLFNNQNCMLLMDKPRVFILNCCRGNKDDFGVDVSMLSAVDNTSANCTEDSASFTLGNEETSLGCIPSKIKESEVETLAKTKDDNYLICYTTLEGLKSDVDWLYGTDFGKAFADNLVKYAWYKNLNSIFTRTKDQLDQLNKKQHSNRTKRAMRAPEWRTRFGKSFYFHPQIPFEVEYPII